MFYTKWFKNNNKAFTLIELMIVVAIVRLGEKIITGMAGIPFTMRMAASFAQFFAGHRGATR